MSGARRRLANPAAPQIHELLDATPQGGGTPTATIPAGRADLMIRFHCYAQIL
jgi:hypothetical protein